MAWLVCVLAGGRRRLLVGPAAGMVNEQPRMGADESVGACQQVGSGMRVAGWGLATRTKQEWHSSRLRAGKT